VEAGYEGTGGDPEGVCEGNDGQQSECVAEKNGGDGNPDYVRTEEEMRG